MEILNHLKNASGSMAIFMVTELMAYHLLFTPPPPPNCSKVFELQQSNQGYGESLGVKEVQKKAKQKYFIEPFWRTAALESLKSMTLWRYLTDYKEIRT